MDVMDAITNELNFIFNIWIAKAGYNSINDYGYYDYDCYYYHYYYYY